MTLSLLRNDPFFGDMDRALDRMFDLTLAPTGTRLMRPSNFGNIGSNLWTPSVDVWDAGDQIKVHADLPGVPKDKVNVELDKNGNLVIEGETSSEKETEDWSSRIRERRYGRFSRVIGLPMNVDPNSINAKFEDGVLDVTVPKTGEGERQRITVS